MTKITDTNNTTTVTVIKKEAEAPISDIYCKASEFILQRTGVVCPGKELEKIVTLLDLKEKRIKRWAKKISENKTAAADDTDEGSDDSGQEQDSDEDGVVVEAVQTEKVNDDCCGEKVVHDAHTGPIYEAFVQNGVLLAPDTLHSVLRILKVRPKRICGRGGLVRPLGVARRDYRYWNQILPRQIVRLSKRKENGPRGSSKGLKKMVVTPMMFVVVNGRANVPFQGKHGARAMHGPDGKQFGLGKHGPPGRHCPGKRGPGKHGKGGPGKHGPGKKHGSGLNDRSGKQLGLRKHGPAGMHCPCKHGPGKHGKRGPGMYGPGKSFLNGPRAHQKAHQCMAYVPLVAFGGGVHGHTRFVPRSYGGRVELGHPVVAAVKSA
uniref:Uncharacterized protein n=1 Tax=Heterosigma akashiwo TaxID=2829 RepID=A0A6S9EPG3_HETAK